MRICHVIASLDPAQGGPPVVAQSLAQAQLALGHRVQLLTEHCPADSPVQCISVPHHGLSSLCRPATSTIRSVVADADILHLHGIWEPLLPVVARTARKLRRPYVITSHGMLDPWSLTQKKWKKRLALALGYRKMLHHASAIHLLNDDEHRLLAPLKLTAPPHVVPNGIFLDEVDRSIGAARFLKAHPELSGRRYILFLSRLHFKKGLDLLADGFAQLVRGSKDIDLVVAGPDGGEEKPFRDRLEQLGIASRVHVVGPVYGVDKWSALAGASVFCLPSRQEGFSVAILEAMACQVPVVISKDCHFPEVAEVGAGRVVSLDPDEISGALDDVLSNVDENRRMGEAGRKLVEQRFTWPRVAEQMVQLYDQLHKSGVAR